VIGKGYVEPKAEKVSTNSVAKCVPYQHPEATLLKIVGGGVPVAMLALPGPTFLYL